jgi:hypothetical protein
LEKLKCVKIPSGINPEDINKDKRGFNPLDIIYKSPEGGCVYVGIIQGYYSSEGSDPARE